MFFYYFAGEYVWVLRYVFWKDQWAVQNGYPKKISDEWPGAPTSIDAVSSNTVGYWNSLSWEYTFVKLTYFFKVIFYY